MIDLIDVNQVSPLSKSNHIGLIITIKLSKEEEMLYRKVYNYNRG